MHFTPDLESFVGKAVIVEYGFGPKTSLSCQALVERHFKPFLHPKVLFQKGFTR
jgi:hypothetical protein